MIFYSWYGATRNYDDLRKIAFTKGEWEKIDKILAIKFGNIGKNQ